MTTNNVAGRRYRALYVMLLRLYPRTFRERFGQGMAQTFHDLCRERSDAKRGLFGLALWIFCETLVGIVTEQRIQMSQLGKTMLRVALGALAVWMVPVVAAQFVEGWHWGVGGFARAYVLFFLVGMAIALIARRMGVWSYKAGVAVALVAGFAFVTYDCDDGHRLYARWHQFVHVCHALQGTGGRGVGQFVFVSRFCFGVGSADAGIAKITHRRVMTF